MKPLVLSTFLGAQLLLASPFTTAEDNEKHIEEVFVTAQKRDENLMSVPVAVDVISGKFIASTGAFGLSELEMAIPSVNFGRGGRKTRGEISIRGVGGFARNIGTGGRVVVYIDDVPLGRSSAFEASLADVKQIEILKGPQGTLYGANTIAGAINITTVEPTEDFSLNLRADYGQRATSLLSLIANVPLSDKLLSRIQIGHKQSDGFIENTISDNDLQGSDLNSARIKLLYNATDNLSIRTSFDWLEDDAKATNAEALSDTEVAFLGITLPSYSSAPEQRQVTHDADEFEKRKNWGASTKVEYDTDSGALITSITAYRSSEFTEQSEEDYSAIRLATSLFDEDYSQWTQELRYTSTSTDRLDYVAGLFFQSSEISTTRNAQIHVAPTVTLRVDTPGELETTSYSAFGNLNYRLTDTLELSLGTRLEYETKKLDYAIADSTGFFTTDSLQGKQNFFFHMPRISLNYESSESGLLYGSISRGAKSGGWNADFVPSLVDLEFDPEYSINYEIGYKNSLFDGSIVLLSSIFHTKFKDFQVSQFVEDRGANTITNAGEVTTEGVEFDVQYFINESISLELNTALTRAKFDRFTNADSDDADYSGNRLPYAPKLTSVASINIDQPISNNIDGYFHLSYSYSDGYFSQPRNDHSSQKVDGFHVINAHLGIKIGDVYDISFWGKNLSDETYLRFKGTSFLGVQRGFYEAPRTLGASLRMLIE